MIESNAEEDIHIYVPINLSDLSKAIPEGEDIIYSTLADVHFISGNREYISKKTHLLMTKKGFVYYSLRKKKNPEPVYIKWWEIQGVTMGYNQPRAEIYIARFGWDVRFKRNENFESKEIYKKRKKGFKKFILPIILESKKQRLQFLQENRNNKQEYKKKWEKWISKEVIKFEKKVKKHCK
ncbi:MAG: hypothetical protein JW924_07500 [Fusobacteriaceae bacterium]|nr:hypothetical protein [Fusobacteriaceae bacterium]